MSIQLAEPTIECLKCHVTAKLDVAGFRKVGETFQPVNTKRPAGWTSGGADVADPTRGLCAGCTTALEEAQRAFLAIPKPPQVEPRAIEVPAHHTPIASHVLANVTESTHAPISQGAATPAHTSIATPADVMKPNRIEPHVTHARGGYGVSMPPSLPSTPIRTVFQSAGQKIAPAAAMQAAAPAMHVQTKSQPLPTRIDCTPEHHGELVPVKHSTQAQCQPVSRSTIGAHSPFTPVK